MSDLKNRVRTSDSVDKNLYEELKNISKKTKIPRSKLIDEAIELLLTKYEGINKDDKNE